MILGCNSQLDGLDDLLPHHLVCGFKELSFIEM